jgi:hypothetical protein
MTKSNQQYDKKGKILDKDCHHGSELLAKHQRHKNSNRYHPKTTSRDNKGRKNKHGQHSKDNNKVQNLNYHVQTIIHSSMTNNGMDIIEDSKND